MMLRFLWNVDKTELTILTHRIIGLTMCETAHQLFKTKIVRGK